MVTQDAPPGRANPSAAPGPTLLVPFAHVGAALFQLLFLKGIAVVQDVPRFGAVVVVLALPFAVTFVALALRAVSATRTPEAPGEARRRFDARALRVGGAGVLGAVLFGALPVADWLHLPGRAAAAAAPLMAAAAVLLASGAGAVLGTGRDRAFAGLIVFEPVLRVLLAAVCFAFGFGSAGLGPILAALLSLIITTACARAMLPAAALPPAATRPPTRDPLATALGALPAVLALSIYGLLLGADVVLARLTLPPEEAGRYAAVAVASRFLILLPFPVSLLLAARVRRLLRGPASIPRELLRTMGFLTLGLVLAVLVVHELGHHVLALVLDPEAYAGLRVPYARYAVAAALFGLAQPLLLFGIALGQVSLVLLPAVVLAVEVPLFLNHGGTLANAISVVQAMAIVLVLTLAVVVLVPQVWVRHLAARMLRERSGRKGR